MTKKATRDLLAILPRVQRTAAHLAYVYRSPRLEADDLTQIGCLAVAEALKQGVHPKGDRLAYLLVIARRAMQRYCGQHSGLIVTPRKSVGYQPTIVVLSLDAPVFADDERTLLDMLADEAVEAAEEYAALHDCYLDCQP